MKRQAWRRYPRLRRASTLAARALLGTLVLIAAIGAAESQAQGAAPDTTEFEPGSPAYEHLAARGFYRRRARGRGWFVTRREPVLALSHRLGDALRIAPGVAVVERSGQTGLVSARSARACPVAVFVDGSYTSILNIDELNVEDITALEVYRGPADVPIEYHVPSYERKCGALLVWSRIEVD